ncbi:MAG TPA: hypothetical protein V6C65_01510 [Allocoleopsis sp.]
MKQVFVAWVPFQRRSVSMQSYFGYELRFLSFAFKNRLLRPLEYLIKGWQTLALLIDRQPQVVWVQLPPTPLLHLAFAYKALLNQKLSIIADCHNATFRRPWISLPGTVALLNRCDLVIVHNDAVQEQALSLGLNPQRLAVLLDPPAQVEATPEQPQASFPHPWVLCPCSFNRDEPIQEILEAARLAPEITFVLTGNPARAQGIHDLSHIPENLKLAGFLPTATFNQFLCNTDAILGLTKLDGIQLSVANEAVGVGKPMVISHTQTLKQLFYKGAIYVDPMNAQSIAQGCKDVLVQKQALTEQIIDLQKERSQQWINHAHDVLSFLDRASSEVIPQGSSLP